MQRLLANNVWRHLIAFCIVVAYLAPPPANGETEIRKPVWAGQFYDAAPETLKSHIEALARQIKGSEDSIPENGTLRALILPHAGYVYSGLTAAYSSLVLKGKHFSKIILMGPDHRVGFSNAAVSGAGIWETPLGKVAVHPDAKKLLARSELFKIVPESDQREHSLEVVLPFLQTYLREFKFIPVVLGGRCRIADIAAAIDALTTPDTLIVVSSDLSHYMPDTAARKWDRKTIRLIMTGNGQALMKRDNAACGVIPIVITLRLAKEHRWTPVLLHYGTSGDTAGDRHRVVGYAAIAFYGS